MPDSQTPQTPQTPQTRWAGLTGGTSGRDYAARFAAIAAGGKDTHGEATFCVALLDEGARVLDAGCGTGRVAIRLTELGFDCVGVDVDESMLDVAREAGPGVAWFQGDLASVTSRDLGDPEPFDMVVLAGNVVPLLAPGTVGDAVSALVPLLRSGGLLVAGFGLDESHLPGGCPVTSSAEYDEACTHHRLELAERFASWDRAPFTCPEGGYAVSVHTRRP